MMDMLTPLRKCNVHGDNVGASVWHTGSLLYLVSDEHNMPSGLFQEHMMVGDCCEKESGCINSTIGRDFLLEAVWSG